MSRSCVKRFWQIIAALHFKDHSDSSERVRHMICEQYEDIQ